MKRFINIFITQVSHCCLLHVQDFLDTAPKDALSPATTWKTETDAESFVVGCYNGLLDPSSILYLDCGSDIGYNNFSWEGWRPWGDGSLSSGNTGASFYDFAIIRRCNTVLENIDNVEFTTAGKKEELIAEAKAIRAYRYFIMTGGMAVYLSSVLILRPKKHRYRVIRKRKYANRLHKTWTMHLQPSTPLRQHADVLPKELFWLPKCAKHYITVTGRKQKMQLRLSSI